MAASDTSKSKPGFFARVGRFFKDVRSELRKVAWPNRKELTSYTAIVLVAVAIVAVYIGVIDALVTVLLGLVLR
ncbi:MAG: preprotein translocase subunit SecE [Bacillota bacterium]|jgi:preprotein translocase subunit SecE|nr:preprotein translocase subunit SecE [Bacillota bacterium]HOB91671.1 preprotein translocase subunit SecE [Bacillota bacterium]HPZ54412.1 preprotein translocase subunit SecE [Bacillota bacterium]HQD17747.1 preprotein translocase subunit SecE [Bacillota bacterium]